MLLLGGLVGGFELAVAAVDGVSSARFGWCLNSVWELGFVVV